MLVTKIVDRSFPPNAGMVGMATGRSMTVSMSPSGVIRVSAHPLTDADQ